MSAGRTWKSFATTGSPGIFGPGWATDLPSPASGALNATIQDTTATNGTFVLQYPNGTIETFTGPGTDGQYNPTGLTAQEGGFLTLSGAVLKLTDPDGTVTTWNKVAGTWAPMSVRATATQGAASNFYTPPAAGTEGVIAAVTGKYGSNQSCATLPDLMTAINTVGCRTLRVFLAPTDTAASGSGDHAGQATRMVISLFDDTTGTLKEIDAAKYLYNADGLLTQQWDPRLPDLRTTYDYDGNPSNGWRIRKESDAFNPTIGDSALTPVEYSYNDNGSLKSVSRYDAALNQDAVTRVVYDVPINGDGLPDLRPQTVATWNQTLTGAPSFGTAIFPPSMGQDFDPSTVSSSDWAHASITYMTANGVPVNTAAFGQNQWLINTTTYDDSGQITATLSAGARMLALQPYLNCLNDSEGYQVSAFVCAQEGSAARAQAMTSYVYYSAPGVVSDTVGPIIDTGINRTAPGRAWTHTDYNEGAPEEVITSGATLPTTTVAGPYTTTEATLIPSRSSLRQRVRAANSADDLRFTDISYSTSIGGVSGWTLRAATKTSIQMDDGDPITTLTAYDSNGSPIESRMPDSNGSDAGTTLSYYYSGGTVGGATECGNHAAWNGLPCKSTPKAQPTSGGRIPETTTKYSSLLQTSEVFTRSLVADTKATMTYDQAGRALTNAVTSSTAADVPKQTFGYDPTTGLPTTVTTSDGTTTDTITTGYDAWGRTTSYATANNTSSTTYTIDGQVATKTDGKGTYEFTYNAETIQPDWKWADYRGLPSKLTVTVGGNIPHTFGATYNADGALLGEGLTTIDDQDNVSVDHEFAVDGTPIVLNYRMHSGDPEIEFNQYHQQMNALGQAVTRMGISANADGTGQLDLNSYTYDDAGRLTNSTMYGWIPDTSVSCETETYGYNGNSDRLTSTSNTLNVHTLKDLSSCGDPTKMAPGTTTTSTFNSADQIIQTQRKTGDSTVGGSYGYDGLGRTTSVPANDTSTGQILTQKYFADSGIKSQTSDAATQTWTRDPARRLLASVTTPTTGASSTSTNHYADASDSPAWITNADGTWTRYIDGLGVLGLQATGRGANSDADSAVVPISDLQGNITSTIKAEPTFNINTIANITRYDAFGAPTPLAGQTAPTPYGWEGTAQRSNNAQAGTILMGARQYNPTTGRFLTMDPIPGGNANAYTYPTDPVNQQDLNGQAGGFAEPNWASRGACIASIGLASCTMAVNISRYVFNKHPGDSNVANAKRHFVWNFMLIAAIGRDKAATVAWAHELETSPGTAVDRKRDMKNNSLVLRTQVLNANAAGQRWAWQQMDFDRVYGIALQNFNQAWAGVGTSRRSFSCVYSKRVQSCR